MPVSQTLGLGLDILDPGPCLAALEGWGAVGGPTGGWYYSKLLTNLKEFHSTLHVFVFLGRITSFKEMFFVAAACHKC